MPTFLQWLISPITNHWARIEFLLWVSEKFQISEVEAAQILTRTIEASESNHIRLLIDWLAFANKPETWRQAVAGKIQIRIVPCFLVGTVFVWEPIAIQSLEDWLESRPVAKPWLNTNPEAKASVERGLEQAARGEITSGWIDTFSYIEAESVCFLPRALILSDQASQQFLEIMENPPAPSQALIDFFSE